MRENGDLTWLLSDHLGSTSVTVNEDGTLQSELRYTDFGVTRPNSGETATGYRYTGQLSQMGEIGLYYYVARWYDPYLNRFLSPDSIVPDPYNPLDIDRYSYARNNPIRFSDPTGHMVDDGCRWESCHSGEAEENRDYVYNVVHNNNERQENTEKVENGVAAVTFIGSIVYEPLDWAITANECFSGDCSPYMLMGLLPFIPSSAGKYADEVVDLLPTSVKSFTGETADTIRGRVAHANYALEMGPGYQFEVILPSGLRADAVDWQNHIVRELKPDNPRAIQKGWTQVRKYVSELFEMSQGRDVWTGYVDTYKK